MKFIETDSKAIRHNLLNLRHLVFEVTDSCNLNCRYCAYSDLYQDFDSREEKNLSFAKAKQIIDYLYQLWTESYSEGVNRLKTISFYGGEPLLNVPFIKQIIDYVENLGEKGIVFVYAMTTNAMLLDKYMDFLVEKEFSLLISLDGDEFAHSYRVDHSGNNSFTRVFRNLKLFQEKYPEYFKSKITFNSVLHNRNDIEPVYRFIHTHFDKTPRIAALNPVGICDTKKDEFVKMFRNPAESFYNSKKCSALEYELTTGTPRVAALADYIQFQSGNIFDTYNDLYMNKNAMSFLPTGSCVPFAFRMFISVNGKILPCERVGHQFSMGQVYDNRVELDEKFVADTHNYYVSKYVQQCNNCAVNKFCEVCVYQVDDIEQENISCSDFHSVKRLEKKNKAIFEFLQAHPYYYKRITHENMFKIV
jgi:uncharacterized protein